MQKTELVEQQIRQIAGDDTELAEELLRNAVHIALDQGQFAFRTGDQCTAYLVVLKGQVRVQLISPVEALGISQAAFQDALARFPTFRDHVFERFSERLKNVIVRMEDLVFESIEARLARLLLKLDNEGRVEVTHQELSVELGTAREVISRHLKRLEADGVVELGRGRVVVTDRDALIRIGETTSV